MAPKGHIQDSRFSMKIDETRRKSTKTEENRRKSTKTLIPVHGPQGPCTGFKVFDENRRKSTKTEENRRKSSKTLIPVYTLPLHIRNSKNWSRVLGFSNLSARKQHFLRNNPNLLESAQIFLFQFFLCPFRFFLCFFLWWHRFEQVLRNRMRLRLQKNG